MPFRRHRQIGEPPEDVRPDRLALIGSDLRARDEFRRRDSEGVGPEQGPSLGEAVRGRRPHLRPLQEFAADVLTDGPARRHGRLEGRRIAFAPRFGHRRFGHRRGRLRLSRGRVRLRLDPAAIGVDLGHPFGGADELTRPDRRSAGSDLRQKPAARVPPRGVDLARPRAQSEAGQGRGGRHSGIDLDHGSPPTSPIQRRRSRLPSPPYPGPVCQSVSPFPRLEGPQGPPPGAPPSSRS